MPTNRKSTFDQSSRVTKRGRSLDCVRSRSGFTLIEMLIASLILAIVLMGLFGALKSGFHLIEVSRDQTRVSQILQSQIEDIRNLNWTSLTALDPDTEIDLSDEFSFNERYTCVRAISDRATDQKQISVTVSWTDNRGAEHSREYLTWYTKNGLNDFYYRTF